METNPAKRRKIERPELSGESPVLLPFDPAAASAGLFRPSTFILETAELLQQSRVDYGKLLPDGGELLRNVKTAVEAVDTHDPILIGKAVADFETKNDIRIPFPDPRPAADSLLKLSMATPAHCNVVGSYVLKTMVRSQPEFAVDLIVEMPRSLFQEKDYLNLRYFYKRAYYLAHIARAVMSAAAPLAGSLDLAFAYLNDNPLLPVLVATPKKQKKNKKQQSGESGDDAEQAEDGASASSSTRRAATSCSIRIIPCCPDGLFPRQKLLANKNCLRLDGASSEAKDLLPPTPFYNATLKADAAYVPYLKLLHQAQKTCPAFVDACLLGRVWLQQRGFGSSLARGGFGAFEWSALIALLLQTARKKRSHSSSSSSSAAVLLSPSLSSTQIFKAVIQFLAATDFRTKPCVVGGPTPETGLDPLREGTPVLYDAGRQLNLGYKMSPWSAILLRQYARWTHELLKDESDPDPFTPTFIAKADIALQCFDMVFRIRCPAPTKDGNGDNSNDQHAHLSRHGAVWDFSDSVYQVLKRAMGDRAKLIHIQMPSCAAWSLGEPTPEQAAATTAAKTSPSAGTRPTYIAVGLIFDPLNMARHMDHGPAAEDKAEARRFRQFWGERAELRRFQDGSIRETLVWTTTAANVTPSALCEEIARYILGRRLRLPDTDVTVVGGSSSSSSSDINDKNEKNAATATLAPLRTPAADAAAFAWARTAFSTLESDLRGLDDLPLHVRQVAPTAPQLRGTSIRPPAVGTPKAPLYPMEVLLYFEASGKWPDSLVAIQRAKIAFLLRIGESLEALRKPGGGRIETHLGLEALHSVGGDDNNNNGDGGDDGDGSPDPAFLDIVYPDQDHGDAAAAFRLRVHCDREEALLVHAVKDAGANQHHRHDERQRRAQRLAAHRRRFGWLPRHHQTVATCVTRFPALGPTVRLAKAWFSAHKLTNHVAADVLVELLVLHVFLRPAPWQAPASPLAGLLRTLQFLARWDWRTEPLVVGSAAPATSVGAGAEELTPEEDAWGTTAQNTDTVGDPRTRLAAWRKLDPALHHTVLFVASPYETSGTAFTTAAFGGGGPLPSKVVAARMTSLARAACRLVRHTDAALGLGGLGGLGRLDPDAHDNSFDPRQLFQPALGDYDVLLHVSPRVVKRLVQGDVADDEEENAAAAAAAAAAGGPGHRHRPVYKNLDARTGRALHPLPAHPVQVLLDQLNALYGSGGGGAGPLVFFHGATHDAYSDQGASSLVVGAVWNPQVHRRPFRVHLPSSFRPVVGGQPQKKTTTTTHKDAANGSNDNDDDDEEEAAMVEVNQAAILAEVARIGGSLIERIEVAGQA
ncbi:pre-rRNA processing protein utp22 [Niveomyces insectorum RCEF 264]|uniref:Pre-rRNA processing protein utp22 n=1 Tax=Niveomyces insectorum RCEF 264 TaxID=1081102 RepID=A0A167MMI2_9HYPO|nr:pre-rRNA processing protein utp22 [Niveomyces insectorum RCEF 264]